MKGFKPAQFRIDCCDGWFTGYTTGAKWNGWACPLFTEAQGKTFAAYWATERDESDPEVGWCSLSNTFIIVDPSYPTEISICETVEKDGVRLHGIGAYGWCWRERPLVIECNADWAICSVVDNQGHPILLELAGAF